MIVWIFTSNSSNVIGLADRAIGGFESCPHARTRAKHPHQPVAMGCGSSTGQMAQVTATSTTPLHDGASLQTDEESSNTTNTA
jgi:hypothetical protein